MSSGSQRRRCSALVAAASLLIAAGCALVVTDRARAAFPGENGRIYFAGERGTIASQGIYSVDGTGKHLRRLTDRLDDPGSVNPLGTVLVFQRFLRSRHISHIFALDIPGGEPHQVAHPSNNWTGDLDPSFSGPAGRRIVYVSHSADGALGNIWAMRADGTHRGQLTHRRLDFRPNFTPDGRTIIFTRARNRAGAHQEIFRMRSDGTHVRALTASRNANFDSDVSPNGKLIAFVRGKSIFTMDLRGHRKRAVTDGGFCGAPSFSPNGRRLVYSCLGRGLVISSIDGSKRHSIGRRGLHPGAPTWAPAR